MMILQQLYKQYENETIEKYFNQIIEFIKITPELHYLDRQGQEIEDDIMQVIGVNRPDEIIKIRRRTEELWDIKFNLLKDAIRFTLRCGGIQSPADYNKMTGTSNFKGTPLRLLVNCIVDQEYKRHSLVGKTLPHQKFGNVLVRGIEFQDSIIYIEFNAEVKKIKMDFWQIEQDAFKGVFDEQSNLQ